MLGATEVQGSYNQAITVAINHLHRPAPEVELARLYLGHKYSNGLVIATLDLSAYMKPTRP